MKSNDYYLYRHTNISNGKVYIGISCQTPEQRWRYGLGYKEQSKFYGAILKYGWNGFKHEILIENLSQEDAYRLEAEYIKKFDSIRNGYNIQNGGEDVGVWARHNLSMPIYQLDPFDFHVIKEYASISDASRELNIAPTAISNAIQSRGTSLGYYWCFIEEFNCEWKPRINLNEQPIYKIDKTTFKIIEKYDSISDACKANNLSYSGLHRCNEFFSLGGYCWCKCCDWYEGWRPTRRQNTATPVYQIEQKSLKILNEWPSIKEAASVLKINKNVISRCCQNKSILAGNWHWCKIENWTEKWAPKKIGKIGAEGRAVYQIDKSNLKIIKEYKSATEAAHALGISNTCISKAACGDVTESGGYYWCYVNLYRNWTPKIKRKTGIVGKKIGQYNLDEVLIKVWPSIKDAADYFGVSASNISNACAGRMKTVKGYIWKYIK